MNFKIINLEVFPFTLNIKFLFFSLYCNSKLLLIYVKQFLQQVVSMSYQIYRNSTLGISLQETLDEMIANRQITPEIAVSILQQYDKTINRVRK